MHFGELIRTVRMERGMSQSVLGDLVGASSPLISAIETGKQLPTQRMAVLILEGLEIRHNGITDNFLTLLDGQKFELNSRIGRLPGLLYDEPEEVVEPGLPEAVRAARKVMDLSCQQVGDLIGVTGQTVSNVENRHRNPSWVLALDLVKALNIEHKIVEGSLVIGENVIFEARQARGRGPGKGVNITVERQDFQTILSVGTGVNEWVRR